MIPGERLAVRWVTALVMIWAAATWWTARGVAVAMEDALAVNEARSVAASFDSTGHPVRVARRISPAAGPVRSVVRQMQRTLGADAELLATDDRARVWRAGGSRYVSVPVKDADAWDIVGVVVLQTDPPPVPWTVWATMGLTLLLGVWRVRRAVRAAASDAATAPAWLVADALAILALGTALCAGLLRGELELAAERLPAVTLASRFDPLLLPLPNGRLLALRLSIIWGVVSAGIFGITWLASPRRRAHERRSAATAWGFLAPSALHLAIFTWGPLLFTGWLSLHRWDLLALEKPFIGIGNYRELFSDPLFWNALRNTALYSLYVPATMMLALGAAVLLNQPVRGIRVLRAMVFLPAVVSYVAIAMVWQWIYHADYGLLNYVIRLFGGSGTDWLGNPSTALVALMIVSAWVQLGYQMVVYLAGLQGIPSTLLEAATLEGATAWTRFWRITVPLLRPVSLYLLVTGIIWSFQVFALVYVMTEGGPARSTDVLVYQIYQNAWEFRRMGYASALSWVLFAILIGMTALQWRLLNRRIEHAA